jgi:hypothetical protein
LAEARDFRGREGGAAHRHAGGGAGVGDALDNAAGGGGGGGFRIQTQAAHLKLFTMAALAGFGEDGAGLDGEIVLRTGERLEGEEHGDSACEGSGDSALGNAHDATLTMPFIVAKVRI